MTDCSLVRDLLPLYEDKEVSAETAEHIRRHLEDVEREKQALCPECRGCANACGHNDAYDVAALWSADPDIRSLKSLILFGLRGMAAYAYHALVLGYTDDEVNRFFADGLFLCHGITYHSRIFKNETCGVDLEFDNGIAVAIVDDTRIYGSKTADAVCI